MPSARDDDPVPQVQEEELKQQVYAQHNPEYPPAEPLVVQDKSQFEPWVSANVEKLLNHVEVEERDLVDDIDMFYPLDRKAAVGPQL